MRILLFNLTTDIDDPILGFTTGWITALAKRLDFIRVITMRAGRIVVPDNVEIYSVGKEKGFSEPRRAVEFYRHLVHILREDCIDACFSHMIPIFSILASPLLRAKCIPLITWYAHPSLTPTLKVAHYVSKYMLSSIETAYPYKPNKLVTIGQGIDTNIFSPSDICPDKPQIILCVGRLSQVKGHPTLLQAATILRQRWEEPFRVVIVGGSAAPADGNYIQSLHEQVQVLNLRDIVHFEAPVANAELPFWYRRCTLHVNLTPTGSADKVAWEAMCCGKPCLAANAGFADTFGAYKDLLLFRHSDAEDLATKLESLLRLSHHERVQLGSYLRSRVIQRHGLENLANKLVTLLDRVRQGQAPLP
jgi:glycosyltransferase involved in cell wall biosynthesis